MSFEFVERISKITGERNYFFVRTDGGDYFDTYVENDFIGIGWNFITVDDLTNKSAEQVKEKIARLEGIDTSVAKGKSAVSRIYNKLNNFKDLKKNDVVVIPSASSRALAFGVVMDDVVQVHESGTNDCLYTKRRQINWNAKRSFRELDAKFYFVKKNMHAISSVNDYQDIIDNVMQNVYFKDDFGYVVLDIGIKEDINARELLTLIDNFIKIAQYVSEKYDLNEDIDSAAIRLNLQSPGFLEIKNKGIAIVLAALIFTTAACGDSSHLSGDEKAVYDDFQRDQPALDDSVRIHSDSLELDHQKFSDTFK